jgi:hypothetical protein
VNGVCVAEGELMYLEYRVYPRRIFNFATINGGATTGFAVNKDVLMWAGYPPAFFCSCLKLHAPLDSIVVK